MQIGHFDDLKPQLDRLVEGNNQTYGAGKWLVVYGGDEANVKKPDIGLVMEYLGNKKSVDVLAVQCEEYAKYMVEETDKTKVNKSFDFLKSVRCCQKCSKRF